MFKILYEHIEYENKIAYQQTFEVFTCIMKLFRS